MAKTDVYLEIGNKKTFAGAMDWPGWARAAADEQSALQTLFDYTPRYAAVLQVVNIPFQAPTSVGDLSVVERLKGSSATDFGVAHGSPAADSRPVSDEELERFLSILNACWDALKSAARAAEGKELRKGPRGGGREVEEMLRHTLESHAGYLSSLGWKHKVDTGADPWEQAGILRHVTAEALDASVHGDIPERGPRGGARWTARYFTRRAAWHILDHAWEIEDRILQK